MLIKSDFKDYYDYLRHVYGIDDKIVYVRKPIPAKHISDTHKIYPNIYGISSNRKFYNTDTGYDLKYVAICGKLYVLARRVCSYEMPGLEWFYVKPEQYQGVVTKETTTRFIQKKLEKTHAFEHPDVIKLHREVGQPVFTFRAYDYKIEVDEKIPNLGELGIPAVEDANQLYQNIGYYLTNVLRGGADISPVSPMTDKEKISSHGFDVKQSFRHRT